LKQRSAGRLARLDQNSDQQGVSPGLINKKASLIGKTREACGCTLTQGDGTKNIPLGDDQDVPSLPDLIFQNKSAGFGTLALTQRPYCTSRVVEASQGRSLCLSG